MIFHIIAGVLFVISLILAMKAGAAKSKQADSWKLKPFPEGWKTILEKNIPLYRRLPEKLQAELQERVKEFIATKHFEGCGGLEVTEEMMVTVAGQACMLLLNRKAKCYPKLSSVLIYPEPFKQKKSILFSSQYDEDDGSVHLGESWNTGSVILAWSSVMRGAMDIKDGHNLVFHEFAHQLDQADGRADGAPILEQRSRYIAWARVLGASYKKLITRVEKGRKTVMDDYGTTNPAEFFAVATETFFEKPRQMNKKYPELYAELRNYFKMDPLNWKEEK